MNTFSFDRNLTEAQRDAVVLSLRRDGFSASRETDTLRTDATQSQVAMSCGWGFAVRPARFAAFLQHRNAAGRRPAGKGVL